MHRSDALEGVVVVHHREHTLLHFTTVPSVDDNLLAACDVEYNGSFRVEAKFLVVLNLCLRSVVNDEVRFEVLQFLSCGADEHVSYEVSLPCYLYDEAHSHASFLVGTTETINYEETLVREFLLSDFLNGCPSLLRSGFVVVGIFGSSPPNSVL